MLAPHGLLLWDADGAKESSAIQATLRGFGRRRGIGHLSHAGHHVYSNFLRDVVVKFSVADQTF